MLLWVAYLFTPSHGVIGRHVLLGWGALGGLLDPHLAAQTWGFYSIPCAYPGYAGSFPKVPSTISETGALVSLFVWIPTPFNPDAWRALLFWGSATEQRVVLKHRGFEQRLFLAFSQGPWGELGSGKALCFRDCSQRWWRLSTSGAAAGTPTGMRHLHVCLGCPPSAVTGYKHKHAQQPGRNGVSFLPGLPYGFTSEVTDPPGCR